MRASAGVAVLENKVGRLVRRGVKRATVIAAMPTTKARVLKFDGEEVGCVFSDDGEDMQKPKFGRGIYMFTRQRQMLIMIYLFYAVPGDLKVCHCRCLRLGNPA